MTLGRQAERPDVRARRNLAEQISRAQTGSVALPSASSATSPSRASEARASGSSAGRPSATALSTVARRWRNEPSNGDCRRSGS